MRKTRVAVLIHAALLASWSVPGLSRAQTASSGAAPPLQPITGNDYTLEVFHGPLLAPTRVIGFAGANAAFGDGLDGSAVNTASPAVRPPSSVRWFDYDLSFGISLPGSFGGSDYQNRGDRGSAAALDRTKQFLELTGGAGLRFGRFGATLSADVLRYTVSGASGSPLGGVFTRSEGLGLNFARFGLKGAYSFEGDQLAVGVGMRILAMGYDKLIGSKDGLFGFLGVGPEVGLVAMPTGQPYRVGLTFRAPVTASPLSDSGTVLGVRRAQGYALPGRVTAPWEFEAGVALQLGRRPLNVPWHEPGQARAHAQAIVDAARLEREKHPLPADAEAARRSVEEQYIEAAHQREIEAIKKANQRLPREKLLVLASVLITGASGEAVSVIGFVDQQRDGAGKSVTYSPRVGVEFEPLYGLLRTRMGTYLEPSRFEDGVARQHFTFGSDLRLFRTPQILFVPELDICVNAAVDVAPRFANVGGFLCVWH